MAAGGAHFLGVGIGSYEHNADLDHAVPEITALHELMGDRVSGEPLVDRPTDDQVSGPTEVAIRDYLRAAKGTAHSGRLLVAWAGHALSEGGTLWLLGSDSEPSQGLTIAEVVRLCAAAGASQVLIVLDTCFAGEAVASAVKVATAALAARPPQGDLVWVGVLASCLPAERAVDGEFGQRLLRLLRDGPKDPALRTAWAGHNEFLTGETIGNALLLEWDSDTQSPVFRRDGAAWWLVPNPLFEVGAPAQVVEHLLRAARGVGSGERSWFTGRVGEVDTVVDWVRSDRPGLRVVTGSAGTGKSAIVGRVVSVAQRQERARIDAQGGLGHADPGVGRIDAHAHARARTTDQVAEELDAHLVGAGVLAPFPYGKRNADALVGTVQAHTQAGGQTPVLVIDGLDEARGQSFQIARDLLARLARFAVVVVSTRDVPEPGDTPDSTLLEALDPSEVLNLDDPDWMVSGRRAEHDYLQRRLSGVDEVMDGAAVADYLTDLVDAGQEQPFLLARVIADQLTTAPVNTNQPGWHEQVPDSITTALDADLAQVPDPPGRDLPAGVNAPVFAHRLLQALTWGLGAGLPEEEWRTIATTTLDLLGEVSEQDISWVLHHLGRHIIQDGEAGVAVYRIAHQAMADHLRPPFTASPDMLFDPAAAPIATALLHRYQRLLQAGITAEQPTYLWRYAWTHTALAGPTLLPTLRTLAQTHPDLRPDLANAGLTIADTLTTWGHHHDALPPVQEAVTLYRDLAADNPAHLPNLAAALTNLGVRYADLGRHHDALPPAEEAVRLYRDLAADNPAHLPDLASALNNLGISYAELGRHHDALPPPTKPSPSAGLSPPTTPPTDPTSPGR